MEKKYLLRAWQFGDEESLAENANNAKIVANLKDIFPHPYTLDDARFWVKIAHQDTNNFAIVVDGKAVGGIGILMKEDIYCKNAEIGYWLGESYWGQGIISAATKDIVDFTFQNYDIYRIYAGVFSHNIASMRVLEKAAFHQEAILKESLFKNGQFYDEHIFALIRK